MMAMPNVVSAMWYGSKPNRGSDHKAKMASHSFPNASHDRGVRNGLKADIGGRVRNGSSGHWGPTVLAHLRLEKDFADARRNNHAASLRL